MLMAREGSVLMERLRFPPVSAMTAWIINLVFWNDDLNLKNWVASWPRQYPRGFGEAVLRAFETHLANSPGRRDLRFKPELDAGSCFAQFWRLPMNDTWEDADLLAPFTYLMTSSKVRNGCCPNWKHVFPRLVLMHGLIIWDRWTVPLKDPWCLAPAHVGFLQGVQTWGLSSRNNAMGFIFYHSIIFLKNQSLI